MSSNTTDASLITALTLYTMSRMFSQYWCIIMFILGVIGHTLNLMVFSRPTLSSKACIRYFMASAMTGYLMVFITLPVRLLQLGYGISLVVKSEILCKLLTFLFSWLR